MRGVGPARVLTLAPLALLLAAGAPAPASAAGLRPGCDRSRPAVAYRPGRGLITPQPRSRPVPCLAVIAQHTSESAMIAVAPSGRLLYAPLVENSYPAPLDDRGPALVASSDDGGASWQALESGGPNHILDVPPWMSMDPNTHRIWFASVLPPLCGADVSWSDDGGRTWTDNPVVGCPGMGSMRILEGPPPAGGARPTGPYPHVVYYCANLSDLSPSNLWCYRSLDGGRTFAFTGAFADPSPKPNCNTQHPARPGAVGPDGDLYFPVYQCGSLSMAISRDEGASWQYVPLGTANVQDLYISSVAADQAGNLYLAWISGTGAGGGSTPGLPGPASTEGILGAGLPVLSISRDRGRTWSRPVVVGPPGLGNGRHIAIQAQGTGRVAISLLANADGSQKLDGYLLETNDALAGADAQWFAAPVNDPATPLISATDSETFGDRLFNFTDTFGPDGEPWAAFHCAKTPACPGQRIGVIGRLAPAASTSNSTSTPEPPGSPVSGTCPDTRTFTFVLHHSRGARVVKVKVFVNGRRLLVRRGHDLRSLTIHRLPRATFHVRIVSTQSTGARIVSRRTYRGCAKGRPRSHGRPRHPRPRRHPRG